MLRWLVIGLCLHVYAQDSTLAIGPGSFNPKIALNDRGEAAIIWNTGGNVGGIVQYVLYRPTQKLFSQPISFSSMQGRGEHALVRFNSKGEALAVWNTTTGGICYAAKSILSANLEGPYVIDNTGSYSKEPTLALNNEGLGLSVWSDAQGQVQYALYRKIDRCFGAVGTIRGAKSLSGRIAAALNDQGQIIISWYDFNKQMLCYTTYSDMVWSEIRSISNTKESLSQTLALNNEGEAIIVWNTGASTTLSGEVRYTVYDKKVKSFKEPAFLAGGCNATPQVVMNDKGDVIVSWSQITSEGVWPIWYACYDKVLQSFLRPRPIEQAAIYSTAPSLALNNLGEAVLTWFTIMTGSIQYALFNRSQHIFNAAEYIEGAGMIGTSEYPVVALNGNGEALLAWSVFGGVHYSFFLKGHSCFSPPQKISSF